MSLNHSSHTVIQFALCLQPSGVFSWSLLSSCCFPHWAVVTTQQEVVGEQQSSMSLGLLHGAGREACLSLLPFVSFRASVVGHASPSPLDILLLFLVTLLNLLGSFLSGHLNSGCLVPAAPYKLLSFPTKMLMLLAWLISCYLGAQFPPSLAVPRCWSTARIAYGEELQIPSLDKPQECFCSKCSWVRSSRQQDHARFRTPSVKHHHTVLFCMRGTPTGASAHKAEDVQL